MSHPQAPVGTRVRIEFAQASDPGRDPNKQVNEDSCGYAETRYGHLVVLCDGMGGHYGGREASRTAIATIFEVIEQAAPGTNAAAALKAAVEEAGRRVYGLGGGPDNRARPGSTVVAMLLGDRGLDVAHVGDSRAYCIRAGQIYPLTRDHSMVQGMIDAGMLTEAEAIGHPDANKITRALGMKPEVEVEVRPEPMELFPGDILLQSSDGLTDLVLAADILGSVRQSLSSGAIPQACNQLVQLANDRGGHDNITVQMVRVVEIAPRAALTIPQAPYPAAPAAAQGLAPEHAGPSRPPPLPQDTMTMTAPDPTPGPTNRIAPPAPPPPTLVSSTGSMALPPPSVAPAPAPAWSPAPVQPTSVDRPQAPVPTVLEPPSNPPPPVTQTQPPGGRLTPYAAQLPLPPPSPRYATGQMTQIPTSTPPPPVAPSPAMMTPASGARPSQGGIVFVIIGMSAVIAVLILLLIWALFLR
ncbi:PP2C family protein-serine/threonine phosphatase [Polyangium aurulentum]|uniref:PP2C family protein-serine/threonine phosphatase n=1 Tax=Polyangium aurulentum TaxID=2567896 RepID=UPI0010AE3170|nr:protein phosphatase 2C domain-containing protein [Polyangium aurulentum]UQA59217.1 protein phosphatase 2C domain-containing protein [Polyangium aurulentum]